MTEDYYSDTSMLSDEERELVAKMRADTEEWRQLPAEQRSKLAPEKQSFPIGIRPDGTVNRGAVESVGKAVPMMLTEQQRDRATGVLLSTAAGDALGAGYEFTHPAPDAQIGMVGGGAFKWAPG